MPAVTTNAWAFAPLGWSPCYQDGIEWCLTTRYSLDIFGDCAGARLKRSVRIAGNVRRHDYVAPSMERGGRRRRAASGCRVPIPDVERGTRQAPRRESIV